MLNVVTRLREGIALRSSANAEPAVTATIAVAVAGQSRLPEMRDTIRRLRAAGASLAGAVLVHPLDAE